MTKKIALGIILIALLFIPSTYAVVYIIEHKTLNVGSGGGTPVNDSELAINVSGSMVVSGNITMAGSTVCTASNGLCTGGGGGSGYTQWRLGIASGNVTAITNNTLVNITNGSGLLQTLVGANLTLAVTLSPFTTTNLAEGNNLYYSDGRAATAVVNATICRSDGTNCPGGLNSSWNQSHANTLYQPIGFVGVVSISNSDARLTVTNSTGIINFNLSGNQDLNDSALAVSVNNSWKANVTGYYPLSNPSSYISDGNTGWDNSYAFLSTFRVGISTGNVSSFLNNSLLNVTCGTGLTCTLICGGSGCNLTVTNTVTDTDTAYNATYATGITNLQTANSTLNTSITNLQAVVNANGNFSGNSTSSNWLLCGAGNYSRWNGTGFGCYVDNTVGGGLGVVTVQNTDARLSVTNGTTSTINFNLSGNQDLNETDEVVAINTTTNIRSLGFNTTTQLDSAYYPLNTNPSGYITDGNTGWDNSYAFLSTFRVGISTGNVSSFTNNSILNITGGSGIGITLVCGSSGCNSTITNTGVLSETDPIATAQLLTVGNLSYANATICQKDGTNCPSTKDNYQWRLAITESGNSTTLTNNTALTLINQSGILLMMNQSNITIGFTLAPWTTDSLSQGTTNRYFTNNSAASAVQNDTIIRNSTDVKFRTIIGNSTQGNLTGLRLVTHSNVTDLQGNIAVLELLNTNVSINQSYSNNNYARIDFSAINITGSTFRMASIIGIFENHTNATTGYQGDLAFTTMNSGTPTETLRLTNTGNVQVTTGNLTINTNNACVTFLSGRVVCDNTTDLYILNTTGGKMFGINSSCTFIRGSNGGIIGAGTAC